jgi:arylformamidase
VPRLDKPAGAERFIDISPKISPAIGVWPGDVPYSNRKSLRMRDGQGLDLGSLHSTYHVGAHTDAPQHYHLNGRDAAQLPLEPYHGRCQVVDVNATRGERFGLEDLKQQPNAPRILFKTGTFPDPEHWNEDFAAPEPELIDRLGSRGVLLVGFDTPSTDLFHSKGLPSHQMLFKHGMMNLEGLVLNHVPAGHYTLHAFPLPLVDADASPVRAVLERL